MFKSISPASEFQSKLVSFIVFSAVVVVVSQMVAYSKPNALLACGKIKPLGGVENDN